MQKNTMRALFSPFFDKARTAVYAAPAPMPPSRPISAGKASDEKPGLTISILPPNAARTARYCQTFARSFSSTSENRIAKNGDILFRMFASASTRWSIA